MTVSILAFMVAGVAAQSVNPTLPGNSGAAVAKVQSILNEVTGASGASSATSSGRGGERAALQEIIAKGKAQLIEDVLDDKKQESAAAHAYINARAATLKQTYSGGCARLFEVCPSGWTDAGSACVNNGAGFCGSMSKSWSSAKKEDFAWRCRASFPCVSGFLQYTSNNAPMTVGNANFAPETKQGFSAELEHGLPVVNIKYQNAAANADPSVVLGRVEEDAAFNRRLNDALLTAQADNSLISRAASRLNAGSFIQETSAGSDSSRDLAEIIRGMSHVAPPRRPYGGEFDSSVSGASLCGSDNFSAHCN